MTSEQFASHALQHDSIAHHAEQSPQAKQEIERFAHKSWVKALLMTAGEQIINLLLTILTNRIIKKYGN